MFQKYLEFIKHHERIVIVAIGIGATIFLGNKYLNTSADKAGSRAAAAETIATIEKNKSNVLEKMVSDTRAVYEAQHKQDEIEKHLLLAAIAKRDADTQQQKVKDANLAPSELAGRWRSLIGSTDAADVAVSGAGIGVSVNAAHATVDKLEDVPRLEGDLRDAQNVNIADARSLETLNKLAESLTSANAQFKVQMVADATACKADKDKLVAEGRKGKRNWFIAGIIVGFFGRGLTGGVASH